MGVGVKGLNVRCVRSAMLDRAAEPCYVLFPLIFGSRNTLLFLLSLCISRFFLFSPLAIGLCLSALRTCRCTIPDLHDLSFLFSLFLRVPTSLCTAIVTCHDDEWN